MMSFKSAFTELYNSTTCTALALFLVLCYGGGGRNMKSQAAIPLVEFYSNSSTLNA
jgi:hypothetical protein